MHIYEKLESNYWWNFKSSLSSLSLRVSTYCTDTAVVWFILFSSKRRIHSFLHLRLFEVLHHVTVLFLSRNFQWILTLPPCGSMSAVKVINWLCWRKPARQKSFSIGQSHPYPILSLDAVSFHGHLCFALLLFQNSPQPNHSVCAWVMEIQNALVGFRGDNEHPAVSSKQLDNIVTHTSVSWFSVPQRFLQDTWRPYSSHGRSPNVWLQFSVEWSITHLKLLLLQFT